MKLDILAFWAHPDDVEFCCSWTLLKHIDQWYTVGICDLTQWELWTRGSAELRLQEAEDGKNRLWAMVRENLGMSDGFLTRDKEHILKIVDVIRTYTPDIILANPLSDRHPDHWRAGKLVQDACFHAWLIKIETGQDPRRPKAIYHYVQDRMLEVDFVVDITGYKSKKDDVMMAYASQLYDPTSTEPQTAISWKDFLEYVSAQNRAYGRHIWVDFAEWFITARHPWVNNLFDLQ